VGDGDEDGELAGRGDGPAVATVGSGDPELWPKIDGAKSRTTATSPPIRGIRATAGRASGWSCSA